MTRLDLCAAIVALLVLAGCTNAVPPLPTPAVDPYLSFLDGNTIHPIETTKSIAIHRALGFPTTSTETLAVSGENETIRLTEEVHSSASLDAHQGGFVLVINTLSDKRTMEPKKYETYGNDPVLWPSLTGTTTTLLLEASGRCVSEQVTGGTATTPEAKKRLRRSSIASYLTLAAGLGQNLRQGQIIVRDFSTTTRRTTARFTVHGYGTYHQRPVIVLALDGTTSDQDKPQDPIRIAGFVIVDAQTGISAVVEITVATNTLKSGSQGNGKMIMSADLSAIGQAL